MPFCTTISAAKIAPQSRDSYQPSDRGVHSKDEMRGEEGSMWGGRVGGGGVEVEISVRMVWRGRVGSQDSICSNVKNG